LSEESQEVEHAKRGVDTNEEETHLPEDDGRVDISPRFVWPEAVGDPEWKWNHETNQICDGNPLILLANGENITGHTPSNSESIELLHILTTPDVRANNT